MRIHRGCLVLVTLLGCAEESLPPAEGFIAVQGGQIWYQTIGAGDAIPLLVIHGGPGDRSCAYLEPFAEVGASRPVIVYDQLGSGRSDRPADTTLWNLPRFVDEVTRLREALNLDEVHILGHSWGAAIAVEYMLTAAPDGVRSLTLAGPFISTQKWIADARLLRAALPDTIQAALTVGEETGIFDSPGYLAATDSFYAQFLTRGGWPPAAQPTCEGIAGFNDAVYRYMWGPTEFTATGTLVSFDRTARLNELDVPVLFIVGRYDEARPETVQEFQRLVPGSVMEIVEDAAHASMFDQPRLFNSAVQDFLASVEAH